MRKHSTNQPVEGRQLQNRNRNKPEQNHTWNLLVGLTVSTFSSAALRHFRFWSISLICSSISRQRLLVTVTGVAQARWSGGRKVKKDTARKQAAKRGGGEGFFFFFQKMGRKHHHGHDMSCLGEGVQRKHKYMHISTVFVTQGPEGANGSTSCLPSPSSSPDWQCSKKKISSQQSHFSFQGETDSRWEDPGTPAS